MDTDQVGQRLEVEYLRVFLGPLLCIIFTVEINEKVIFEIPKFAGNTKIAS